jgi:hypothetical protein
MSGLPAMAVKSDDSSAYTGSSCDEMLDEFRAPVRLLTLRIESKLRVDDRLK